MAKIYKKSCELHLRCHDTQHKVPIYDTQHNNTSTLNVIMQCLILFVVMLSIIAPYL